MKTIFNEKPTPIQFTYNPSKGNLRVVNTESSRMCLIHVVSTDKAEEIFRKIEFIMGDKLIIQRKGSYQFGNKFVLEVFRINSHYKALSAKLKVQMINFDIDIYKGYMFPHPLSIDCSNLDEVIQELGR